MKRGTVIVFALLLSGCASPGGGVMLCGPGPSGADQAQATCNWALGPSPADLRVAASLNYRTKWPSVATGYRFDDVSFFADVQYDDQYYFGRYGGYSRYAQTVRTAVLVR